MILMQNQHFSLVAIGEDYSIAGLHKLDARLDCTVDVNEHRDVTILSHSAHHSGSWQPKAHVDVVPSHRLQSCRESVGEASELNSTLLSYYVECDQIHLVVANDLFQTGNCMSMMQHHAASMSVIFLGWGRTHHKQSQIRPSVRIFSQAGKKVPWITCS